jgi:predicted lipid-binding transport protein (Tim44 family)
VSLGVSLALLATEADAAKRLGGGKSVGRQSTAVKKQQQRPPKADQKAARPKRAAPPQQAAPVKQSAPVQQVSPKAIPPAQPIAVANPPQPRAAPVAPQTARSRWWAPLTGIATALGIAAVLSHLGLIGPLAELLGGLIAIGLAALAGLFIWRLFGGQRAHPTLRREVIEPVYGFSGPAAAKPESVLDNFAPPTNAPTQPSTKPDPWGVPADFDTAAFLSHASANFLRLQTAWDTDDTADLAEFTTPDVFAELKLQLDELKGLYRRTEVDALDAELLGIETSDNDYLASVRFSGKLRHVGSPPEPFAEVWNLSKPKSEGSGWLVAGIQQVQ